MRLVLKNTKAGGFCMVSVAFAFVLCMFLVSILLSHKIKEGQRDMVVFKGNRTAVTTTRKLLHYSADGDDDGGRSRIGRGCSNEDIVINQGQVDPLPSGIPSYAVQITNTCAGDDYCNIANIRVRCGWFSSARLINPRLFRRVEYDDCLVNGGEPLGPGKTIFFHYANTYRYSLSVASVACLSS